MIVILIFQLHGIEKHLGYKYLVVFSERFKEGGNHTEYEH